MSNVIKIDTKKRAKTLSTMGGRVEETWRVGASSGQLLNIADRISNAETNKAPSTAAKRSKPSKGRSSAAVSKIISTGDKFVKVETAADHETRQVGGTPLQVGTMIEIIEVYSHSVAVLTAGGDEYEIMLSTLSRNWRRTRSQGRKA